MADSIKVLLRMRVDSEIAEGLKSGQVIPRDSAREIYADHGLSPYSASTLFNQAFDGSAFERETGVTLDKIEFKLTEGGRKRVALIEKGRNIQETNFAEVVSRLRG